MTIEAEIVPLAAARDHIPTLVRWFEAEWAPWYGPNGHGDARHDLDRAARHAGLPYALIALAGDRPVGTASLRADSVGSDLAPGPWLAAILVDPDRRGGGIGTALVAAVEAAARDFGYDEIFTSTDTAAGIMLRRGWTQIGLSRSMRGEIEVFRKDLSPR